MLAIATGNLSAIGRGQSRRAGVVFSSEMSMTSGRMHSGGMLLGAARIEAEAIRDAKAEGQPSPPSSTIAVALVDQARTKLPSVSHSQGALARGPFESC